MHRPPTIHRRRPLSRAPGLVLAVFSFLLILWWAAAIRPLGAPDEPAHLLAITQVQRLHILPEVHYSFTLTPTGTLVNTPVDAATQTWLTGAGVAPTDFRGLPYESMQPPLFYGLTGLVAMPLALPPAGALYLGRLIAALFGAGTVYFCWAATRQLAPGAPQWAVAAAGAIALLPQFCFNSATAANDSALNCAAAAAFYVWFRALRQPGYDRLLLRAGAVVGLGLLAKLSAGVLLPGLALVVLFRAGQGPGGWRKAIRHGLPQALGAGGALLVTVGPWLARNLVVYGEPSGSRETIRFYQATFTPISLAAPDQRAYFLERTWQSTWGVFGWFDIRLPDDFYNQSLPLTQVALALTGLALAGLGGRWLRRRGPLPVPALQAVAVLVVVSIAMLASYVEFNQTVAFQAQGRYLFQLLLPGALLFTGGLYALPPTRLLKAAALSLPLLWLALMNAVGLALVR